MGTYKDYFLSHFPKSGGEDILQHVYSAYRNNSKFLKAQELQSGPSTNVFPYSLNAHIDSNLLALNNKYLGLKATSEINEARNWRYTQKILCRRLYEADVPEVVDVMQPFLGLAGVTEVSGKHLVVSDELMKEEYK